MTGDDDGPDCLALVIQDGSERYEAEEPLKTLFQADPAPALIARRADQRFVRVNRGFLEVTGYGTRSSLACPGQRQARFIEFFETELRPKL